VSAPLLAAGALAFAAALAVGVRNWRWSLYALLAYIPVSGILITAAYGERAERAAAVLAKDYLFVVPAYVGFAVWALPRRRALGAPGGRLLLALLGGLAVLAVAQAFNPSLPNYLVGAIGLKIWVFYLPLFVLGYHLVRTRGELRFLLGLMSVTALIPAIIGLVEAGLVYSGHEDVVYRVYGDAAGAVTQGYVGFALPSGAVLKRIPSTFSSFYQYYTFLGSMLAVSYAWSRWQAERGGRVAFAIAAWLLVLAASFLVGVRTSFFLIPVLLVLIVLLDRGFARRPNVRTSVAAAATAVVLLGVTGALATGVYEHAAEAARQEFGDVIVDSPRDAVAVTWVGRGAGIDSTASRYAFGSDEEFVHATYPLIGGRTHESWYVKTYVELGALGLALVVVLLGVLVVRLLKLHVRLRRPELQATSAAFLALLLWVLIYGFKAPYVDLDPLNVYFWLFAGLLFRLPSLDRAGPVAEEPA
jgi:hypothetical protein